MLTDDLDFLGAHTLLEIARAAELEIAEAPRPRLEAEIRSGVPAAWYLCRTAPGKELRAHYWLPRRRFGSFLPMQRRRNANGVPIAGGGLELMFPTWIFARVWYTSEEHYKLLACPGVAGLLEHPDGRAAEIDYDFVMHLRQIAEHEAELAGKAPGHAAIAGRRHARRMHKHDRKKMHRLTDLAKSRGVFEKSDWADIMGLDPHERIAFLQKSLAAPSQVHKSSGVGG
jgi:hypothetical protein